MKFEELSNGIQILKEVSVKVRIKTKEVENIPVTKKPETSHTPAPVEETPEPSNGAEEEPEESTEPEEQ